MTDDELAKLGDHKVDAIKGINKPGKEDGGAKSHVGHDQLKKLAADLKKKLRHHQDEAAGCQEDIEEIAKYIEEHADAIEKDRLEILAKQKEDAAKAVKELDEKMEKIRKEETDKMEAKLAADKKKWECEFEEKKKCLEAEAKKRAEEAAAKAKKAAAEKLLADAQKKLDDAAKAHEDAKAAMEKLPKPDASSEPECKSCDCIKPETEKPASACDKPAEKKEEEKKSCPKAAAGGENVDSLKDNISKLEKEVEALRKGKTCSKSSK